jgi:alkylation response protein AidB-like acyl-CoA dehydrogenase
VTGTRWSGTGATPVTKIFEGTSEIQRKIVSDALIPGA